MPSRLQVVGSVKAPADALGTCTLLRPHLLPSSPVGSPPLGWGESSPIATSPAGPPRLLASPEPCPGPMPFQESLHQTFPKGLHPHLTLVRGSSTWRGAERGHGVNRCIVATVASGLLPKVVSQQRRWSPAPRTPRPPRPSTPTSAARTAPPSCPEFLGPLQMQVSSALQEHKQSMFSIMLGRGAGARSRVSGRELQMWPGILTWPRKATGRLAQRHGLCWVTSRGCHRGSEAGPLGSGQ